MVKQRILDSQRVQGPPHRLAAAQVGHRPASSPPSPARGPAGSLRAPRGNRGQGPTGRHGLALGPFRPVQGDPRRHRRRGRLPRAQQRRGRDRPPGDRRSHRGRPVHIIDDVRGSAVDIPVGADGGLPGRHRGGRCDEGEHATSSSTTTPPRCTRWPASSMSATSSSGTRRARPSGWSAPSSRRAFGLGEDYYVIQGSGSSQPYGLLTALGTSGAYVTSHTPSASTVAGNWATGRAAKAAGAVANRGADPNGALVNSGDYWISSSRPAPTRRASTSIPTSGGFGFQPTGPGSRAGPWGMRLAAHPEHADRLARGGRLQRGASSSAARATAWTPAPRLAIGGTRT